MIATSTSGITYTLEIPAGALTGDVAITLTPILDMGGAPLATSVLGAVQMEPSGLKFQIPATLKISVVPSLAAGQNLTGFSTANDGSGFRFNLVRIEGPNTLVNVSHFSTGGAATPTPAQMPPLAPLAPTLANADDAIAQLAELTARNAGLVQIVDVFRQWYVEIVKPALVQADGSTDVVFSVNAISAYKEWIGTMAYIADQNSLALALAGELGESATMATRVFKAFVTRSLDDCANTSFSVESRLASVSLASTVQGIAQSVGLGVAGSGLDRAGFLLSVNNCLRPVLDPIRLPSGLAIGTGKSLDARALLIFSGQPNPVGSAFRFTVTATGATLSSGSGNSDATGRYTTVFTPRLTSMQFTVKACLVFPSGTPTDICVQQDVSGTVGPLVNTFSGTISFQQPGSGTSFTGFLRVSIAASGAVNTIKIVEATGNYTRTDGTDYFCPNGSDIAPLSFTYTTPNGMRGIFEPEASAGAFFFLAKPHYRLQAFVEGTPGCETYFYETDETTELTLVAFPFITVVFKNNAVESIVLDKTLLNGDGRVANIYAGQLELDK